MKIFIVVAALGAAALSTPLFAQAPGGHGNFAQRDQTRDEAKQRADMIFQMIDVNHTGVVTRAQAEQAVTRFQAMRGGDSGRGGGMMQRMLDEAFGSGSSLTLQQFEAEALARFDAMDLNHDGVVTAAERQQFRQQHAGGPAMGSPSAGAPMPPPPPPQ